MLAPKVLKRILQVENEPSKTKVRRPPTHRVFHKDTRKRHVQYSLEWFRNFRTIPFHLEWLMFIRVIPKWLIKELQQNPTLYVDQKFLFQFLLQNIDKIKGATLYVLSSLIFPSYFRHDLDCSRHFAIFWKIVWVEIL